MRSILVAGDRAGNGLWQRNDLQGSRHEVGERPPRTPAADASALKISMCARNRAGTALTPSVHAPALRRGTRRPGVPIPPRHDELQPPAWPAEARAIAAAAAAKRTRRTTRTVCRARHSSQGRRAATAQGPGRAARGDLRRIIVAEQRTYRPRLTGPTRARWSRPAPHDPCRRRRTSSIGGQPAARALGARPGVQKLTACWSRDLRR